MNNRKEIFRKWLTKTTFTFAELTFVGGVMGASVSSLDNKAMIFVILIIPTFVLLTLNLYLTLKYEEL
jgi:hypothetical protein